MAKVNWTVILRRDNARLLRFILWAVAMVTAGSIVGWYWPHKAIMVPAMFLAIMVPAVLLPLHPKPKENAG